MSSALRPFLQSPRLEARSFATGMTAAASAPLTLADLANDAAGGHPAQRMTLNTVVPPYPSAATAHTLYVASGAARFLRVTFAVESAVTFIASTTWVTVDLTITDSAGNNVPSSNASIPYGLKADVNYGAQFGIGAPQRFQGGQRPVFWLDVDALVTAGLVASSLPWRFTWTITAHDNKAFVRGLQVEERSRLLVDEAESFGQVPTDYLPRGAVVDGLPGGLPQLWKTVRAGLTANLRTYHGMARTEADAWLVSSTSFAAFGGDDDGAGAACVYRTRGRRMYGTTATPVRWCVFYKFTGGSAGQTATVKLTTGTGSTTATLSWADNTTWHLSSMVTGATLDNTGASDTLTWTAKVSTSGPVLHIAARYVFDNP